MQRNASAHWSGGLKDGKGTVSTESGVVSNVPYNFAKRFENEKAALGGAWTVTYCVVLELWPWLSVTVSETG